MLYKIINPSDKATIHQVIDNLSEKKKWEVSIKVKREIRSLPANRLYWLWLGCISDETGNDKGDLHYEFGIMFLPTKQVKIMGKDRIKAVSTSDLDSLQFSQYLTKIQQFAGRELGIVLPLPEDLIFADFLEKYKDYI